MTRQIVKTTLHLHAFIENGKFSHYTLLPGKYNAEPTSGGCQFIYISSHEFAVAAPSGFDWRTPALQGVADALVKRRAAPPPTLDPGVKLPQFSEVVSMIKSEPATPTLRISAVKEDDDIPF